MKIKKYIKQLICKHNYKPWANIYGDLINDFDSRTVCLCEKCYKRKFIKDYIKTPLNYNKILEYLAKQINARYSKENTLW